jgi:hypothetical protein
VRVTTDAVEPGEESLTFGDVIGGAFVLFSLLLAKLQRLLPGDERRHLLLRRCNVTAFRRLEVAVFSVAAACGCEG